LESQLISLNQVPLVGPAGVSAPQHGDYNTVRLQRYALWRSGSV